MMTNNTELIGNISTIIKLLLITIFPSITTYITTDLLSTGIIFIVCLCFGIIDAKYPNTFKLFDNHKQSIVDDEGPQ